MDGVNIHIGRVGAGFGAGDGHYAATVIAGGTLRALRTLGALRALRAVGQEEGLRLAAGLRDADHVACGVNRHNAEGGHVAGLFSVECVRDTQQLLRTLNAVIDAAVGVEFRFQEEGTISPVDAGHGTTYSGTVAHLKSEQSVGIGGGVVRLHIHGCAVHAALQNGNLG